jgi:hypothetical protein
MNIIINFFITTWYSFIIYLYNLLFSYIIGNIFNNSFKIKILNSDNTNSVNNLYDFIYLKENVITKDLCKEIIDLFEKNSNNHYNGLVLSGYRPDIKNTKDFSLNPDVDEISKKINDELTKILAINIKSYFDSTGIIKIFSNFVQYDYFMIQKYFKNEGKYDYHNDFFSDYKHFRYRACSYIFYLNDVKDGGETEFWYGKYKIKPKAGNLLIFPSFWCFPHTGKMPISNDKYIITGWVYVNENIFISEKINNFIELKKNNNLSENIIKEYNIKDIK